MSWGERSCLTFQNSGFCEWDPTFETCNHHCKGYEWDGLSKTEYEKWYEKGLEEKPVNIDTGIRYSEMSKSQKRRFRKQ